MEKKGRYRKGIFAVVYARTEKGIEYLVLKRKLHWKGWEFVKGKIESSETKKKAVRRELKEETGLIPIKIKMFKEKGKYEYEKIFADRTNYVGQTYILFAVEVKKREVKVDKREHSDYKWLGFDKTLEKLTFSNQRKCLKIANNWLNSK